VSVTTALASIIVPPFYLNRAIDGSFATGADAIFTAKEAK